MKRNLLAIGIILLFVGVTIAPTINFNTVKASTDDDLVEVTTQACGIQGYGDTTVKLTREQYQDLEQYLVDFRERLNQTTTREEAVSIFKDAVVELDKYGLLPKGMSVKRVQNIVIRNFQNERLIQSIKKKCCDRQLSGSSNFLCLVAGYATNMRGFGPLFTFIDSHGFILYFLLYRLFDPIAVGISLFLTLFSSERDSKFPLYLYGHLCFGSYEVHEHGGDILVPSEGWITSYGIVGERNSSGVLYGQIHPILGWYSVISSDCIYYYQGIRGFTGLKIYQSNSYFYLGSCLEVNVNSTIPDIPINS
ncbi:MAG TPA: hypothetical protein VN365_01055 [Candidatus Thermoplasmatota archaeon]|nr:hypothetical protein [Candidatus Thermoplasmatota archaeon]